ncbi:MAG: diaminobutyrate acetyltransferase [Dehalococcoidia bacterium]
MNRLVFRSPTLSDGAAMWRITSDLPNLEANSPYSYLMVCRDFGDTSIVAEDDGSVVAFVSSYRPFRDPRVLFVWQIGVAESHQGAGLGKTMLSKLLEQPGCAGVSHLEATVTPSNIPSQRLFKSLARHLGAACQVEPCFTRSLFPEKAHEDEDLFRIGPFQLPQPR